MMLVNYLINFNNKKSRVNMETLLGFTLVEINQKTKVFNNC